ncbi:MAG TPA: hypothetical protein VGD67_27680 [Pseudonocardiaceae bacterium]
MVILEPSAALATCERALRQLITATATASAGAGANWITSVAKPDTIQRWSDRRREEAASRGKRGVAEVDSNLLAYASFFELVAILERSWEAYAPALGRKKETGALLARFDDLRNAVAHNRELLPFERELLSGIAGEIRNRVTIHLSSQDPSGDFYPRIEAVSDSLGNTIDTFELDSPTSGLCATAVRLSPGDTVVFRCDGVDPQGRDLTWSLRVGSDYVDSVGGDRAELRWNVTRKHVGHRVAARIYLRSDSEFHRWAGHDQGVSLSYTVLPPIDG